MSQFTGKPILAVPLGDAAGIGPEIIAKLCANGFLMEHAKPVLVGDEGVLKRGMRDTGVSFSYTVFGTMEDAVEEAKTESGLVLMDTKSLDASKVELSVVSAVNGKEEADNLVMIMDYCKRGLLEGFCFGPLNKAAMKNGGYHFESEHELFAQELGVMDKPHGEMNVLDGLWTSRATSHIPLKDVSAHLTLKTVGDAIDLAYETLKRAGYEDPKVAIAAINPHGGDSGTCGREEIDVLRPAVARANAEGRNIVGPFPSDTLFIRAFKGEFDAVVTMYHDQGQIALKLKGFERGVTVAAGQPYAITTPAHGTAYDIAGTGTCTTSAFETAYKLCAKMAVTDRAYQKQ